MRNSNEALCFSIHFAAAKNIVFCISLSYHSRTDGLIARGVIIDCCVASLEIVGIDWRVRSRDKVGTLSPPSMNGSVLDGTCIAVVFTVLFIDLGRFPGGFSICSSVSDSESFNNGSSFLDFLCAIKPHMKTNSKNKNKATNTIPIVAATVNPVSSVSVIISAGNHTVQST